MNTKNIIIFAAAYAALFFLNQALGFTGYTAGGISACIATGLADAFAPSKVQG